MLKSALRRERPQHRRVSSNNPLHLSCGEAVTIEDAEFN
jgi:hypothetical protein